MQTTLPFPQAKGFSRTKLPKRRWMRWTMLVAALALISGGIAWWLLSRQTTAPTLSTSQVSQGDIAVTVSGGGTVQAARTSELSFQQTGTATEVDVKVGDQVTEGQTLAKMDSTALELALKEAQANLASAQAALLQTQNGSATEEEIASAKAQIASAQAQLQQTRTGTTTKADLQSAQAALESAQAQLDALKNPTVAKLSAAQVTLDQAKTNLQSQRDSLSQAKTSAYNNMQQAVDSLTQAQTNYGSAKNNWDNVQNTGNDPSQSSTTDSEGNTVSSKVSDTQRQEYYSAYVQAEASLHSAETAVQQAQLDYDAARQNEATQLPLLEQQVANAQTQLDALKNPSAADITQAQASVTQAQANLTKLKQGGTAAEIAQSQASVTQAQANLDGLLAPATDVELANAQAQVTQAEVAVAQAQTNLDEATLKAPFDGIVASVSVAEGSNANVDTAAVTIIDTSTLHINVSLSETDAAKVKATQPVTLTFDALPDVTLQGTVASVAPVATSESNVVTYQVQVSFVPGDAAIKVGMSATAEIQVDQAAGVLLVPTRAITTNGDTKTVTVLQANTQPPIEIPVTTGLASDGQTQIVSSGGNGAPALKAGDTLMIESATTTTTTPSSTNRTIGFPGGMPGLGGPPGR